MSVCRVVVPRCSLIPDFSRSSVPGTGRRDKQILCVCVCVSVSLGVALEGRDLFNCHMYGMAACRVHWSARGHEAFEWSNQDRLSREAALTVGEKGVRPFISHSVIHIYIYLTSGNLPTLTLSTRYYGRQGKPSNSWPSWRVPIGARSGLAYRQRLHTTHRLTCCTQFPGSGAAVL